MKIRTLAPFSTLYFFELATYSTNMGENYDYLFKFLIIGNAGVGKSCLLHQFIENKFKNDTTHTIGVEFGSKVVRIGNSKSVKLQIWDTAGQERFRSVTRSYYRGAAGALLVYDVTSRDTYNALSQWLQDARTLASQHIVVILVGNKKDQEADREVTLLEASRFAQENEMMFIETSAATGENVEETFLKCARTILSKIESGELDPDRIGSGIQFGDGDSKSSASLQHRTVRSSRRILSVAFLSTLKTDEKTLKNLLSASLGLQITREIYDRLSENSEIEREKAALTLRVADYLKSNPRASEQQKIEYLRSEFENFAKFLRQN